MYNRVWILIVVFFLFFSGYLGFGSIVIPQGRDIQYKAFSFDGLFGVAESGYFGSISNDVYRSSFCGSNDGDAQISNSMTDGDRLVLISSLSTQKRSCDDVNYVEAEVDVEPGVLTVSCDLYNTYDSDVGRSGISKCVVDGHVFSQELSDDYPSDPVQKSITNDLELVYDESQTITVGVYTTSYYTGTSTAKLILEFESDDSDDDLIFTILPIDEPEVLDDSYSIWEWLLDLIKSIFGLGSFYSSPIGSCGGGSNAG